MPYRQQPSRLLGYPHWETRDVDEATLTLSQEQRRFRHEIPTAKGYLVSANTADLEWLTFSSFLTPSPQKAWAEADGRYYLLMFWNRGWNNYRFSNGRHGRVVSGEGLLSAPHLDNYWYSPGDRDVNLVRIPSGVLLKEAENLAGRPIPHLEPSGTLLKQGPIWRFLHRFLGHLESGLFRKPSVLRQQWQRRLVTSLVLGTPHNIPLREERAHNIAPLHANRVRLAKEFFEAHLGEPVWVGDAAKAAGTSEVGLRRAFAFYNQTPYMEYEEMRMEAARKDLLAPEEHTTIASVCDKYGLDPGRFAADYRAFHDEYPHETLQMGRFGRKIYCFGV